MIFSFCIKVHFNVNCAMSKLALLVVMHPGVNDNVLIKLALGNQ